MNKYTKILAFTLTLGGFTISNAQTSKIRKEAETHYNNKDYHLAAELYAKVYQKDISKDEKARTLFLIAECYRHINDLKTAEVFYVKAIAAKYPDPVSHYYLAEIRRELLKCDDAIEEYKNYQKEIPSAQIEDKIKSCELSKKWQANPTRHLVENMYALNSPENDYSPAFEDQKKFNKILISTNRVGASGHTDIITGHLHSDLYESTLSKTGKWSEPKSIGESVNTNYNDGSAFVSKKGDVMYYTHCSEEKGKVLACNIWVARKSGAGWGDSSPLPFESDTVSFRHPCLSPDGNTLYFASDMAGGYGGHDIWKAEFDKKNKSWGQPVNLGPAVNTSGTEAYPFLHDDNKSLFFSSNGHTGMGGLDMFVSTMETGGKFSSPVNLQYPMNSPQDDFGIIFEGKKERGYFTSDREGGRGGDDIWSFVVQPVIVEIEGYVLEKGNDKPVKNATIYIKGDNNIYFPVKTDEKGYYNSRLDKNTHYSINCETDSTTKSFDGKIFLANDEVGKLETFVSASTKFRKDFILESFDIRGPIKMPAVYYEYDKWNLTLQGKDSLEYLYKILVENPTIKIELQSHTDTRGSHKHNDGLSQKRAQSCVDYLVSAKGIPSARITAKGYGKHNPKIPDAVIAKAKTQEEKDAMHAINRRTGFKITSWNYIDPKAPAKPPVVLPKVYGEENAEE